MLKIRLARTGRKKLAHYRVVVSDSRQTPKGGFVAQLGHYNPHTKEMVLDADKTQGYIDNGAQMSSRVVKLLRDHKDIKLPDWAFKNLQDKPEQAKTTDEEPETSGEEADVEDGEDDIGGAQVVDEDEVGEESQKQSE